MTKKTIQEEAAIPEAHEGMRLDRALALLFPEHSRTRLQSWLKRQELLVDGKPAQPKQRVQGGESIVLNAEIEEANEWTETDLPLNIVFENDDLIIVNKAPGLVTHPAAGHQKDTLANALLHYDPSLGALPRAGLIHRLDKDTSGLLVVARSLSARTFLVKTLQDRDIHREYTTLINGVMTGGGTVDAPIGRHPISRKKMAIVDGGKPAVTHYRIVERFASHTLLRVKLETGRTHQIRVHLASLNHGIVGDKLYGGRPFLPKSAHPELIAALHHFQHQALHATQLKLPHPVTKELMTFHAPLPEDMERLIDLLKKESL